MYKLKNKVRISILTMLLIVFGCCFVNKNVLANDTESISSEMLSALSVKCQVKDNTDGSADLRIVSTVDELKTYGTAGFDIYVEVEKENGEKELELLHKYEKPYVTDKIGAKEDGVSFEYNPKVFDTISNYFITVTITDIPESDFGYGFLIKPFVTMSGTPQQYLYGESRYVKVNDALNGEEYLSVPVAKLDDTTGCSVKVGDKTYSSDAIEFYNNATYDSNYTHVRVKADPSGLQSITKVSVLDGEQEVVNTTYRNLYSTSSAADTTWYDYAKAGKYVLATKADLLGLEKIVNDPEEKYDEQFLKKTIYLGADLVVNDMTATEMKTAIEDEEVSDPLLFTPIGKSVEFTGIFDGQGQTISGIAISEGTSNAGLFGCTNASTIIMNLNLRNCYVKGVDNVGSLAGKCGGTFENVSSDALIDAINNSGGILGNRVSDYEVVMKNCSYSGTLTASTTDSSKKNIGGMIGLLGGKSLFNIEKCSFTGGVSTNQTQCGGFIGGVGGKCTINITDCQSRGRVTANNGSAGGYIGVMAVAATIKIENSASYATVKISAQKNAGGFIGLTSAAGAVTFEKVQFAGSVMGPFQVGGFIGGLSDTTFSVTDGLMSGGVQATLDTEEGTSSVGGICGFVTNSNAVVKVTRCLITGTITYNSITTGYGEQVGHLNNGKYTATNVYAMNGCCENESEVGIETVTATINKGGRLSAEELQGDAAASNASGLFGESTWTTQVISHPIPTAFHWYYSDTTKTEFVINNEVEFFDLAKVSQTDNFAGKTVSLGDNIVVNEGTVTDMTGEGASPLSWTPIGSKDKPFAGIFDGQNHTISGIYINSSTTDLQGLFASVGDNDGNCQIKNFTLNNTYIQGEDNTGSIVAAQKEKATFENLTSNAVIEGVTKVGGILGEVYSTVDGTTIKNCTFNGSINATGNNSGGMIGLTSGKETDGDFTITLNNCTFGQDGSITGTQVGGMIGGIGSQYNKVTLTSCISKGTITAQTGTGIAGGLIGKVAATKKDIDTGTRMNSCTITATLSASEKVGKYVGDILSTYKSYVFVDNVVLTDEANAVEDGNIIE